MQANSIEAARGRHDERRLGVLSPLWMTINRTAREREAGSSASLTRPSPRGSARQEPGHVEDIKVAASKARGPSASSGDTL